MRRPTHTDTAGQADSGNGDRLAARMWHPVLRVAAAAVVLLLAAPVVVAATRAAVAAWWVFPTPSLTSPPPTSVRDRLQQAVDLVPASATYRSYLAQHDRAHLLASWDSPQAPAIAERAWTSAQEAIARAPGNGYHHLLAGSVAAWAALRADVEDAGQAAEWRLRAVRALGSARRLLPYTPFAHDAAGRDLLRIWTLLSTSEKALAMEALRTAGQLEPRLTPPDLALVWDRVPAAERPQALRGATPPGVDGEAQLAAFLLDGRVLDEPLAALAIETLDRALAQATRQPHVEMLLTAAQRLAVAPLPGLDRWETDWARSPRLVPLLAAALAMARSPAPARSALLDRGVELADAGTRHLDPDASAYARRRLAGMLSGSGRDEAAWALYEPLIDDRPDDTQLAVEAARALLLTGRYDDVVEILQTTVQRAPTAAEPRQILAETLARQGEWVKAAHHLEARLARDARNFAVHAQLGRWYRNAGMHREALNAFEEALRLEPADGTLRAEMAALRRTGR